SIRSRQITSYFPDVHPSMVWRTTVAPSAGSSSNQCSPCNSVGLTTRNARAAPGRSNSSQTMTPALYKRGPSRWGAGAVRVGQTRPKSAIRAAIRSGGAATIRSWSFLIFIGPSPHHVRCDRHEDATIRTGGGEEVVPRRAPDEHLPLATDAGHAAG